MNENAENQLNLVLKASDNYFPFLNSNNIMYQFIRNSINMSDLNNGNVIEENMFTFLKLPMTFKLGIYVTLIYFL